MTNLYKEHVHLQICRMQESVVKITLVSIEMGCSFYSLSLF